MATCIRVDKAKYQYPGGEQVLGGISFGVDEGDYLMICGANGSGKSTIGFLLNGLIPHFFGGNFTGTVEVFGIDTRFIKVSDLFTRVGLVLQNADAQLFNSSVEDELAFGLESLGLSGEHIEERIWDTAKMLQIDDLLNRSPNTLSGGEKRMVGIASILCLRPSILILDEPYANLDSSGVSRARRCLHKIHESGVTLIVIEQRVDGFLQDATRCLVVDQGKIIFDGKASHASNELISLGLIPNYPKRVKSEKIVVALPPGDGNPLISVCNLTCQMNGIKILDNISFDISKGEAVALLGKNGSGKTTLAKHLNGLYRSREGIILFNGENLADYTPGRLSTMIGLSFQNPNDQFFKNRVEDELRVGLLMKQNEQTWWLQKIYSFFQLHPLLNRPPFKLSEGEKKRVAISSIITMKPELVVLDEPSAGQDGRAKVVLASMLNKLNHEGFTTLCITHDIEFARAVADRWIILDKGRIVADALHGTIENLESMI